MLLSHPCNEGPPSISLKQDWHPCLRSREWAFFALGRFDHRTTSSASEVDDLPDSPAPLPVGLFYVWLFKKPLCDAGPLCGQ
jgi:hypothetical protein